jgi:dihydroxyacid dehydratase/phosphogluconate dehydratase
MAGRPWSERIKDGDKIAASNVKDNPVLLSTPKRPHSGIDVLTGNFFESAVVKISGMSEQQIRNFDNKIAAVLYFENEEAATQRLLDQEILKEIVQKAWFTKETLIQMYQHNLGVEKDSLWELETPDGVFQQLIEDGGVRLAIVIAGQGPEAFGMPEMFTPMQHLNHNTRLKKLCTILSDGRYSGVSYGAAIGHVTPEAYNRGGILYLQNGDLLHLQLRQKQINLLDRDALEKGEIQPYPGNLAEDRHQQGEARLKVMEIRRGTICPLNGLSQTTDASHGVVPLTIWDWTRHS